MPNFDLLHLLVWLHFVALAAAIGGGVSALMISGLEGEQPEFQGLAAALWAKQVRWGMRIAVILGVALLVVVFQREGNPFHERYLHLKAPLAILALVFSEMSAKSLAARKRGAALLALLLMLLAGFAVINRGAFQPRHRNEFIAPAFSK